eukprot:GFYU01017002.1.p1 GENE.GFYU01017002.1~~GFYU01017002.1.p1  ORF type:complete len:279 (-),score=78.60 GFYU01017002.1:143-928(-)
MYVTRKGLSQSLPPHNDRQDVFIVQVEGEKTWYLSKPKVELPLMEQIRGKGKDVVDRSEMGEIRTVTLYPGDILYLPRGWMHSTTTDVNKSYYSDKYSIHFTVELTTDTASLLYKDILACSLNLLPNSSFEKTNVQQAYNKILNIAKTSLAYRKSLPFGFMGQTMSPSETREHVLKLATPLRSSMGVMFTQEAIATALNYFFKMHKTYTTFLTEFYKSIQDPVDTYSRQLKIEKYHQKAVHEMWAECGVNVDDTVDTSKRN